MRLLSTTLLALTIGLASCAGDDSTEISSTTNTEAVESVRAAVSDLDFEELGAAGFAELEKCPLTALDRGYRAIFDNSMVETIMADEGPATGTSIAWKNLGFDPVIDCGLETETQHGYGVAVATDVNDAVDLAKAQANDGDRDTPAATVEIVDESQGQDGEVTSLCVSYPDSETDGWCEVHWTDTQLSVVAYWYGPNRRDVDMQSVREALLQELPTIFQGLASN